MAAFAVRLDLDNGHFSNHFEANMCPSFCPVEPSHVAHVPYLSDLWRMPELGRTPFLYWLFNNINWEGQSTFCELHILFYFKASS